MKAFLPLFMAPAALFADMKISDYQWKNRLLVISGDASAWSETLKNEKTGIVERHVKVFLLGREANKEYAPDPQLKRELEARLKPDPEKPTIYLIGKDGRTTLRWSAENFSFQKLYESIDAMPMRQREMRQRH